MEKSGADTKTALILDTTVTPEKGRATTPTTAGSAGSSDSSDGTVSQGSTPSSSILRDLAASDGTARQISFGHGTSLQRTQQDIEAAALVVPVLEQQVEHEDRIYWEAFFVNMPMFCGYAALFGLQHEIKSKFNMSDNDIELSRQFGVAVSFLYIFNLIFRFSHNILFGAFGPRARTCIAMVAMMLAMLFIVVPIFIMESYSLYWVYLAYALGGVAVGTFEANFLCCLTPLGPQTKHVAITAIPFGITAVLIGAFAAMGPPFGVPAQTIYLVVAASVFGALLLFVTRIPSSNHSSQKTQGIKQFATQIGQWRQWLPLMWTLPVATAIDMFTLSAFSPGGALYLWDGKSVEILPGMVMNTHDFFVIFNSFNMLGGFLGRFLSYRIRPRHPLLYATLSISGATLVLTKIPILAPLSTFIVMMGDGLIYGTITRRIDAHVPKEFNLIALSFWLFVGDFGSVAGSNLISYIRVWVVGH